MVHWPIEIKFINQKMSPSQLKISKWFAFALYFFGPISNIYLFKFLITEPIHESNQSKCSLMKISKSKIIYGTFFSVK